MELLEGLLDLTLNVFTGLREVGGMEVRPAATLRRLLKSLSLFPPPQMGRMSERLYAAVAAKRADLMTGIARQARSIARRLSREQASPGAAVLGGLWRRAGSLLVSSTEPDLRSLSRELAAAVSGPLREQVGYRDPLRFQDDILTLRVGNEADRTRVLRRWAAQIERTCSPKDQRIRRILARENRSSSPKRDSLKCEAILAGLWEAVTEGDRLQRVRLGAEWVKDHARPVSHPGPMCVRPSEYLAPEEYWLWLRRRAITGAEKYILGVPRDAYVATTERAVEQYEDRLRTRTPTPDTLPALLRRSLEDSGIVRVSASDDAADAGLEQGPRHARLERLLTIATPDEQALLNVWMQNPEAKAPELARRLNKTPAAVRKLQERIRRRASQV